MAFNPFGLGYSKYLTNFADIYTADASEAIAIAAAHPDNVWNAVYALGGDDKIVRDRTGGYGVGAATEAGDMTIHGGSGVDTVSYELAPSAVSASLASGLAKIQNFNTSVFGSDILVSVENLTGTVHDDTLIGDDKANVLMGLAGDDVIDGGAGDDTIFGGNGDDHILGGAGDDMIYGGAGDDAIWGGSGDDMIAGGGGNDTIYGGDGNDEIYGGDGHDVIRGGNGDDLIYGGGGNDEIYGDAGRDTIYGGDGDDYIRGGSGNDVIHGGDGSNEIYGDSGHDTVHLSGFGNNHVDGGSGTDTVVFTQQAVVNLYNDFAWRGQDGVDGMDTIVNVENVTTGGHDDVVIATDVRNVIRAGGGDDFVMAMGGDDVVYAGAGDDVVYGGDGDDDIYGENGDDYLDGGAGDDMIVGGRGADRIRGGAGDDDIWLGRKIGSDTDRDVLIWKEGDIGLDTVRGFDVAHDRLNFGEGFLAAGPQEDNLLVWFDGADAMLAANIADHGWDFIARFKNVNAIALDDAIESGSVFDVQVSDVGDGAPGAFAPADDPFQVALGVQLQIMF